MANAPLPDRLAGSYPYLTMLATATCGWLMALQHIAAKAAQGEGTGDTAFLDAKIASTRFYLQQIMPAATGLAPSALAGDAALPEIDSTTPEPVPAPPRRGAGVPTLITALIPLPGTPPTETAEAD